MDALIRSAYVGDAMEIAHIHVDSWRTTYKGIVADDFLANMSYERRERAWKRILSDPERKGFTYVAEDEAGHMIGFIDGGPEREGDIHYKSELYAIYLLEAYQGQGVGRRLVGKLVESLIQEGMSSMLLWVLAKNPARNFYEALNGQYIREKNIEIGGVTLVELAYGWHDTHPLLKK